MLINYSATENFWTKLVMKVKQFLPLLPLLNKLPNQKQYQMQVKPLK